MHIRKHIRNNKAYKKHFRNGGRGEEISNEQYFEVSFYLAHISLDILKTVVKSPILFLF